MELLKEVTLAPKPNKEWPHLFHNLSLRYAVLRRIDCAPIGESGMLLLVQVYSNRLTELTTALNSITEDSNVQTAYFSNVNETTAIGFIVLKNSPACRAIKGQMAFCKTCLLRSEQNDMANKEWRIILEETALESLIAKLKSSGMSITIKDMTELQAHGHLTSRQDEILKIAFQQGYFDFPKKHNMNELANSFGISIPTLSETLRRAEKKIVSQYYLR